ncbi:MAG: shikimate kinase [Oscillospiraceae bacterium]|nr:shikimate kinase [Oscillospiraceae bacterium]
MTIYLCGFMGCGKSTVGTKLAKKLNCPFVDMDTYIEEQAGMTIPEIFEKYGEPHFRDLETQAIRELAGRDGVIACGGGAMLREENAEIAAKNGSVVYLEVPFHVCYRRIADSDRPIVRRSSREELETLYNYREGIYRKHSTHIAACDKTPAAAVADICSVLGLIGEEQ